MWVKKHIHKLHKLERISERQYNGCHIWLFFLPLSVNYTDHHRTQLLVWHRHFILSCSKDFFYLLLQKQLQSNSSAWTGLAVFSKLLFTHSVTGCKVHFIELNTCHYSFSFTLKKLILKNPGKPFKGNISEDQACLLAIWRGCLSFCKIKAKSSWSLFCNYFNS